MEDGAAAAGDGAARAQQQSSGTKRARGVMRGGIEPAEPAAAWGHPPPALPPPQQQAAGAMGTTASRICRMRGGTGGKDRHSKVYTAKGIRDRRVRLSVPTAIQFYDLQDRLGYDQPSKAIEWLINAATDAIDKLPELDPAAFAAVPSSDPTELMAKVKQSKSSPGGSGSTSETSKGSELSLSRSDSREVTVASTSSAQAASFTELLTGVAEHHRQAWQAPPPNAAPDCADDKAAAAANGLFTGVKFGNAAPFGLVPAQPFSFPITSVEMPHHHFSDALAAASAPAGDYSLNFSMSSGFLGAANRGTLQSNSQASFSSGHHHQQLQPLLFGHAAAAGAAHPASENQLTASAALQLWDGFRHSGMKEKTKN
ncbi:hypothetical protein PR202_ga13706 [Eleusine coracana subsp. coracana]|uniref:TCP domain-containing protein n=1 Tax=Eleusine coracana subsp. coracana TaxID=191504 RepID=A0AAV5CFF2_ELECO|nr:hypothetical protein QOZ80_3AG0213470 [Eleusine coracana subsp. coracana]GJM96837.1 hypothetical protein PR202_ga13706 [Eleusine coracana subsp. coracana]